MNRANRCMLGLIFVLALGYGSLVVKRDGGIDKSSTSDHLQAGRELFVREWIAGDPRSYAGDGLGPVFNARSCVACHNQGGIGGSGARKNNAVLVSVAMPARFDQTSPRPPARAKLAAIHPALKLSN